MDNVQPLEIPGARGAVEIENPHGILYKIRVGGDVVSRRKGAWAIPLRNGTTGTLSSRGIIPGFQSLYFNDVKIFQMGAHVSVAEKVAMFLPLLLVGFLPFGFLLALALFFMGIPAVKNPLMPRAVRIALPVVNTLAGAFIMYLITRAS